jgi:hypothetical protein
MIDKVDAITTLASVVLGAVLALAGGIWTERWKQRKDARAAARLVWLELLVGYSALLAVVALDEWPANFAFSDDAWIAQRDRLALIRSTNEFQELQTAYLVLRQLAQTPLGQRTEPVLCWPILLSVDRALRMLGETAGLEPAQLDQFRTPLRNRLAELRAAINRMRAMPGGEPGNPMDDALTKTLDDFPPELRAHAAEALTRVRSGKSEPGLAADGPREPASGDPKPNPPSS